MRVFDGVGDQVEQNPIEAQFVTIHILVSDIFHFDEEFVLSRLNIRTNDVAKHMKDIRQRFHFLVQRYLSGFDAAHIQNVIDQRKEMFRRLRDDRQILLNVLRLVDMACRAAGESDNRVHRGADVMGHIVQKCRFGAVGCLCHP